MCVCMYICTKVYMYMDGGWTENTFPLGCSSIVD